MKPSVLPDVGLGEIRLKVSRLERSVQFYQDVIGLKLLRREAGIAEMTADGRTVLLVLEEVPDAVVLPPRSHSGLYHFALLLPTRRDLGVTLNHLLEAGIPIGQADHLVSEALYLSDPDHNGIEIYRDRPRDTWQYDEKGFVKMATIEIDWNGLLKEAEGTDWEGLPPETKIGHLHFHVDDLDKARAFYCDLLGFRLESDWRRMGALFVAAGGYHHHIGLNIWAGVGAPPPPENGTGIAYCTLQLPGNRVLEETVERLEQAGIPLTREEEAWFVSDPAGIRLKLSAG